MLNASFKSRIGLIENLRKHLLKGKWAALCGGPMLGKSTLAAQLAEDLNDETHQTLLIPLKAADPETGFWSLLFECFIREGLGWNKKNPYRKHPASLPEFMSQIHHIAEKTPLQQDSKKIVLLIDDCDRFLAKSDTLISQIANMATELTDLSIHAICWIGGLHWEAWAQEHRDEFILPLRFYPLSVVPIREARKIILERMGPERVKPIWNETGGHPYLMERALGRGNGFDVDDLTQRILSELRPEEASLYEQLHPEGEWMILDTLKDAKGMRPPKTSLDRLCMAGLAVRTLDEGTAVIRRSSPLFRSKVKQ